MSFSEGSTGMSPAAMFLSAFSPSTSVSSARSSLPDDEGQEVGGYTLGPIIGHGGFSTIRKASSITGGTVAVKIVRRSDVARQENPTLVRKRLSNEESIWSSLCHEHILPLFSAVHTAYADFFVTLYCPAGTLFDILQRESAEGRGLAQDDAGMMFRQVVRGLRYLHEVAGLVHRDIKLENVLVDDMGVCKIGDFGMTAKIGELDDETSSEDEGVDEVNEQYQRQRAHSSLRQSKPGLPPHLLRHHSGPRYRNSSPLPSSSPYPAEVTKQPEVFNPGSLPYASPELLLPHSAPLRPHPAQDMWALGVLLYALLTGRLPFMDSFEPRLQMKILHGVYDMPSGIGRGAEQVLQGCLERSVSNRWTIAMVDDVAWGVGWGAAGDDVTPSTEEVCAAEMERTASKSKSRSRSHSRPADLHRSNVPTPLSRRSDRSVSRARQGLSPSSGAEAISRSTSRSSTSGQSRGIRSPSFSALTKAILSPASSNDTVSSNASLTSSAPGLHGDSALLTSPPLSPEPLHERGRRPRCDSIQYATFQQLDSSSRSPSPSVIPITPVDMVGTSGKREDTSRGRKASRRFAPSPLGLDIRTGVDLGEATSLDVVHETRPWFASPDGLQPRTRSQGPETSLLWHDEQPVHRSRSESSQRASKTGRRSDSMPPSGNQPWSLMVPGSGGAGTPTVKFSLSQGVGEFVHTPTLITMKPSGRSKSLGPGRSYRMA
ncbi:kinase-like protein [Gloeophyllum trabeum ATCC 11539]|uniref:Kinase-like protein n=1 Tax=Gloeophyllum trabeum (strain ATCC 11539 / FP-39264 / Madison 617) TaxID=670483 RepID=S7RPP5_GLOTA|nr:kinase-like protein [Gloeophyllum trabeum ATCC 11539]EPQ54859.1 kinase-like protein [Gloeophyllum trabeum ATCC 11539]